MGNLKGKNKENKDTTENKPVKAGSTHQDDTGGIFTRKVAMIIWVNSLSEQRFL